MSWARAHRKLLLRGGVVALIAIAYFVRKELLPDFNLEDAVQDLSEGLGAWTYLLVGALAFLETGAFVGLIAPGEFTVILGGAVAGQGQISLPLIIAITWLCAFLGDSVSFMLGSRLGREFLVRHGEKVRISEPRLKQGRGLLLPPRWQDDPDRALHRAGQGARAIHRRQQPHGLPGLCAPIRSSAPGSGPPG